MSVSKYVVRQDGVIVGILCKGCGVPIRGLVPVGEPISTRKNGNTIIRDNYLMLGVGSNYTEVEIEVEKDGRKGKHVTCLCKTCARKMTKAQLQDAYDADLDDLEAEGQNVKELRKWKPGKILKETR
jgi:hypothetical protein